MSVIFGWPDRITTLVIGVVCVLYTTMGGIKAVTWTDVLQMSIIFFGLILGADHRGLADAARRQFRGRRLSGGRGRANSTPWICISTGTTATTCGAA